jgi:RHS repeat-associated protein
MSFGFDSNGNTTTQSSRIYTYSQNQRLIQVVDGAMTAGYTYNGNGQRVKKVVNGITTIFHYSLNGQIIAESDSAGTITAEYVYLNGQPLAKMEGAGIYYYHNDHLGTPQKLTDSTGQVVWAVDYKPFGEATIMVNTITNNLRFPGQYFDAETGLNYNLNRDYHQVIGRYIEADPIGLAGGMNPFVYSKNNAINLFDPSGLFNVTVIDSGGRNGSTYGGTIIVTGDNGQTVTVNGSSWPNPSNSNPGIAPTFFNPNAIGGYPATYSPTGLHGTDPAIVIQGWVPTNGPNPNQNGLPLANLIRIHCGNTNTNRGSSGCITIQPDQCQRIWNLLQNGQTGTVNLTR